MNSATTKTTACPDCGATFTYTPVLWDGRELDLHWRCQACVAAAKVREQAEQKARRQRELEKQWSKLAPPEFFECDPARLPDPALLSRVLGWKFGPRGLLLHGQTGRGKTRCAWQVLRREHFAGRSIGHLDGFALAMYPGLLMRSVAEGAALAERLARADLLLLDDCFKPKLTERAEELLFLLVDRRTAHRRPSIVTTNDVGETLISRVSEDRAEPLIRRLREFCECVAF